MALTASDSASYRAALTLPTPMKILPRCAILLFVALSEPAIAQDSPQPPVPARSELAGRRARLMDSVKTGVILVRGSETNEDMGLFVQNHEFYYLVGLNEPNLALLLFPETKEELLFAPAFNPMTARWEGERVAPGKRGVEATGIAQVLPEPQLMERLDKALAAKSDQRPTLWTPLQPSPGRTSTPGQMAKALQERQGDPFDGRLSREQMLKAVLEKRFAGVEVKDLTGAIHSLRGIKQKDEIACITRASEAAAQGIAEAMKSCEPGMFEFEVAAIARYVHDRMGANGDAYGAIVGAGKNGCVLHYMANMKRIEPTDLIVMDYAPMVANYCADVTRTFPASGKFSDEQRKLVQDLHEIQQQLVAMDRPGVSMGELESESNRMLSERGYRSVHGMSHHVGLAVHDVGGHELKPGMVITVEPGAYLDKKAMGCRIEDTVLVTEDGHVNLSAACPSSPDAIEKLMAEKGIGQARIGTKK